MNKHVFFRNHTNYPTCSRVRFRILWAKLILGGRCVTCMHISACTYMLSVYDFPYKYVLHVEKKFSLVFIFSLFVYFSNKVIHYYTLFLRLFISHTFRVKSHKEVIPYYNSDIINNIFLTYYQKFTRVREKVNTLKIFLPTFKK